MTINDKLTQGRRLARNSILNFIGYFAPMLVAVFTIPPLVRGIGTDRFGVLTLAWVLIGYLSLFDMGLSRALTKMVAERLGSGEEHDIPALVRTGVFLLCVMGICVAVIATPFLPWLVRSVLNLPLELQTETLNAFYLLVWSLPVVIPGIGLRGVLDAYQRFDLTNAVRVTLGIFSFSAPLLVLFFSQSLFPIVGALSVGRVVACMVHLLLCLRVVPRLRLGIALKRGMAGQLIRFGGWMTVTNVISPLMIYLDRFLIGSILSATAVAYYATPSEVVTKLWLLPGAMMGVLFPAFSTSFVQNRSHTVFLFERGVKYIFLALFPITLLIITLANEGLDFWLGGEFAQNSTRVLQWMAAGVFVHSLGQVPYSLIQGAGRPDLTAKLRLAELPFYLILLWWLISANGIVGATIVWTVRIIADTLVLFAMARRLLQPGAGMMLRKCFVVWPAFLTLAIAMTLTDLALKGVLLSAAFLIYVPVAWFLLLTSEERMWITRHLTKKQMNQQ